ARHARVHLDDDDAARVRVDGELDVAATRVDAHLADHRDADVTQLLVLAVGERERGRDRDRVARVHADRVDVLDRAHDHDVVVLVAHELELVLLPAEDRLLEEHLRHRRVVQALPDDAAQLLLVVREARAEATHRERRPHDHGVAEVARGRDRLLDRVHDERARGLAAALLDDVLELLAVLALLDRRDVRADELDAVLREHARLVERDRRVERGLPAERGQERVGALLGDDRREDLGRDRLDVRGVGELGVGHDRGRVRVHEDDPQALLLEHAARLGAGVVELARLADDDRAGPDDQDAGDVGSARHGQLSLMFWSAASEPSERRDAMSSTKRSKRYAASCGPAAASGWYWTEKAGRSRHSSPSTTWSLSPTWDTTTRP